MHRLSGLTRRGRFILHMSRKNVEFRKFESGDGTDGIPHSAGNLPGGGLGKLRHTREEVYFCQQQHKLIQKLIQKYQNPEEIEKMTEDEKEKEKKIINDYFNTCGCNTLGRSTDIREEGYFYSQQVDDMSNLRKQQQNSKEKVTQDINES